MLADRHPAYASAASGFYALAKTFGPKVIKVLIADGPPGRVYGRLVVSE